MFQKMPQIKLVGLEGPFAGRQFTFDGPDIVLGRGQGCHIIIPSGFVSRRHCVLSCRQGHWELEDLGARNPARINGGVNTGPLRAGDVLSLADTRFRIEFPNAWTADERPTQLIQRDNSLMSEYAEVLRELEQARGRRSKHVASVPRPGEPLPFSVTTDMATARQRLLASGASGVASTGLLPAKSAVYDRPPLDMASDARSLDGGGERFSAPEPTADELALLSQVERRPAAYPELSGHYVRMATFGPGPMRPSMRSAPPPTDSQEVLEKPQGFFVDFPSDIEGPSPSDDPPTVHFMIEQRSWKRPLMWALTVAGLVIAVAGARACTGLNASSPTRDIPLQSAVAEPGDPR